MESTNVPMSKRLIGIALAAVFIVGSIFIPGSETLGHEGVMTLGLLLALVSLWVTSALPLGVTALFMRLRQDVWVDSRHPKPPFCPAAAAAGLSTGA